MKKKSKRYRKRFRPEKLISERAFLTGERFTKEDLPRHLEIVSKNPKKPKDEPVVNGLTRKILGSGKRPRWMDCPEEEVNEGEQKKETENSS